MKDLYIYSKYFHLYIVKTITSYYLGSWSTSTPSVTRLKIIENVDRNDSTIQRNVVSRGLRY